MSTKNNKSAKENNKMLRLKKHSINKNNYCNFKVGDRKILNKQENISSICSDNYY